MTHFEGSDDSELQSRCITAGAFNMWFMGQIWSAQMFHPATCGLLEVGECGQGECLATGFIHS